MIFSAVFLATVGVLLIHPALDPGLETFYDRTAGNQLDRDLRYSLWGQEPGLAFLQTPIRVGSAVLAVLLAFIPRRRTIEQFAALAAAVVIAGQIGLDHWFFLYIPWFFVALAGGDGAAGAGNQPAGRSVVPRRNSTAWPRCEDLGGAGGSLVQGCT